MKKWILMLLVCFMIVVIGCASESRSASYIDLTYFKDSRTGNCYAYAVRPASYGDSIAIATVPCESIPDDLMDNQIAIRPIERE